MTVDSLPGTRAPVSPARLAQIALRTAGNTGQWLSAVQYDMGRRWYLRLTQDDEHEIWLLTWLPGQETGFHDHGPSSGAFAVASGCLRERTAPGGRPQPFGRAVAQGAVRSFGPRYVHDVRNQSEHPAVSIHVYSPPLSSMRRFEVAAGGRLVVTGEDRAW